MAMAKCPFTHPSRMGDLLWSLTTVKAYVEQVNGGEPVNFLTSPYCRPLLSLLNAQPYIAKAAVYEEWELKGGAPEEAWEPPDLGEAGIHLGYRKWPSPTLGEYYPKLLREEYGLDLKADFNQPWLEVPSWDLTEGNLVVSFTDEYAEIKAAWISALVKEFGPKKLTWVTAPGQRLAKDFWHPIAPLEVGLFGLAQIVAGAALVVTDNSMVHPLAAGLGKKAIIAEPQKMRCQPVFQSPVKNMTYWGTEASPALNSFELVELVKKAI